MRRAAGQVARPSFHSFNNANLNFMMKKTLCFIALLTAPLFALSAQQLKVVDWNIRSFEKGSNPQVLQEDIEEYVNFLKETEADIICLNEFETGTSRMGKEKMAELASRIGNMFGYFIKSYPKDNKGFYGNVILSKYPIIASGSALIKYEHFKGDGNYDHNSDEYCTTWGADQRSVGYADILLPENKVVRVCCTHLDHMIGADGKLRQVQEVADFISVKDPACPMLLMGDFNDSKTSSTLVPVATYGDLFVDNWVDIMYGFPKGAWEKIESTVKGSGELSDHNAIVAVLKLN